MNEYEPDYDTIQPCEKALSQHMQITKECKSLIDGAFDIVEMFNAKTPAQVIWKRDWLMRAARIVPQK